MKRLGIFVSVGLSLAFGCTTANQDDYQYGRAGSGGAGRPGTGGNTLGGSASRGGATGTGGSSGGRANGVGGSTTDGGDSGGDAAGTGNMSGGTSGGSVSEGGSTNEGGDAAGGTGPSTGGDASGGTSTGGKATGGTSTGGVSTGGTSTGGKSTGGAATGGSGTGGAVVNGCTNSPCLNGATCTAGSGMSYTCSCTNRFVGSRCETQKFLPITVWPTGLSGDGLVVVGRACSGDKLNCPPVKVASTGGAVTTLAFPATLPTGYDLSGGCEIHGVNSSAAWIGAQCYGAQGWSAIEWKSSNTAVFVAGRTTGELVSDLTGGSADGSIVVGSVYVSGSGDRWFRRIPTSGIVVLSQDASNPDDTTGATATSNDGLVVAGMSGIHAVRWDPTFSTRVLPEIAGQEASSGLISYRVTDVSGDGSVIVGYQASRGVPTALRWNSATTVTALGNGTVRAANLDGTLLVGVNTSLASNAACVWDSSNTRRRMIDFIGTNADAAGWDLKEAVAVSDDGKVIVGTGTNASSVSQGWVLHVP